MRYSFIDKNDFINAEEGTSVSLWMQGCPHHCEGCHNPELWDYSGGYDEPFDLFLNNLTAALRKNGIKRNLSILGGEPLCKENVQDVLRAIKWVKLELPKTKILIWTGYTLDELKEQEWFPTLARLADTIIDGKYVAEERDITLYLRGSRNQKINRKGIDF